MKKEELALKEKIAAEEKAQQELLKAAEEGSVRFVDLKANLGR
jgi:hypothetical protein